MTVWIWGGVLLFVLFLLVLDLGVLNRKAHVIGVREALGWCALWVSVALLFAVVVHHLYEADWLGGPPGGSTLTGNQATLQYITGYVVEESLSMDNMFVIALIFAYLQIPLPLQHSVLFWGILGAIVLRGTMILGGTALIQRFDWITYVFGGLLLLSAVKLLRDRGGPAEPGDSAMIRAVRRVFPVTDELHGDRFFTKVGARWALTPLFVALIVVELSDVLFAFDSIPAVFAVTQDPFVVFTSNIFAILGLRSLYFAIAAVIDRFHYLKTSLVYVLLFVAVKILLSHHYSIPTSISLAVIVGFLGIGIGASVLRAPGGIQPQLPEQGSNLIRVDRRE